MLYLFRLPLDPFIGKRQNQSCTSDRFEDNCNFVFITYFKHPVYSIGELMFGNIVQKVLCDNINNKS